MSTLSTQSSNSTSDENISVKSNNLSSGGGITEKSMDTSPISEPSAAAKYSSSNDEQEEQLVYLVTNILFTVLWRGVDNTGGDSWKERGQVIACINMLALNNQLYCSHLTLKLRILEMAIQACLIDLAEMDGTNVHYHNVNLSVFLLKRERL